MIGDFLPQNEAATWGYKVEEEVKAEDQEEDTKRKQKNSQGGKGKGYYFSVILQVNRKQPQKRYMVSTSLCLIGFIEGELPSV